MQLKGGLWVSCCPLSSLEIERLAHDLQGAGRSCSNVDGKLSCSSLQRFVSWASVFFLVCRSVTTGLGRETTRALAYLDTMATTLAAATLTVGILVAAAMLRWWPQDQVLSVSRLEPEEASSRPLSINEFFPVFVCRMEETVQEAQDGKEGGEEEG